jgi:ribosomal protein S4
MKRFSELALELTVKRLIDYFYKDEVRKMRKMLGEGGRGGGACKNIVY